MENQRNEERPPEIAAEQQDQTSAAQTEETERPEASPSETLALDAATEDDSNTPPYLDAPFSYDNAQDEQVVLNNGSILQTHTDLTLPGKNGLDLVIARCYDSANSNESYFKATKNTRLESLPNLSPQFGLGYGWSFNFPSYERSATSLASGYIHMGDGRTYTLPKSIKANERVRLDGTIYLYLYKMESLTKMELPPGYGWVEYRYRIVYKDGRVDYIGEKYIVATVDRFQNVIRYDIGEGNGQINIDIKDSLGRQIFLRQSGNTLTWSGLPDGKAIEYTVINNELIQVRDQVGRVTRYEYSLNRAQGYYSANYLGGKPNYINVYYHLLQQVTHPTGLVTRHSYALKARTRTFHNDPRSSHLERYELERREDFSAGAVCRAESYEFTSIYKTSSTSVERIYFCTWIVTKAVVTKEVGPDSANWLETTHVFEERLPARFYLHTSETTTLKGQSAPLLNKTYAYNDKFIPLPTTVTLKHGVAGPALSQHYLYDGRANVKQYTDPDGNVTTCTYSNTGYNLPTSKQVNKTHEKLVEATITEYYCYLKQGAMDWHITYETPANSKTETLRQLTRYIYREDYTLLEERRYFGDLSGFDDSSPVTRERTEPKSYLSTSYAYTQSPCYSPQPTAVTRGLVQDVVQPPRYAPAAATEAALYNWYGLPVRKTDGNGNATEYAYDALGRVTQERHADGATKSYAYTVDPAAQQNRIVVTDERGDTRRYEYTGFGKIQREYNREALVKSFEYDASCRLWKERSHRAPAAGQTDGAPRACIEYDYDWADRVTAKTVTDAGGTLISRENAVYDDENLTETRTLDGGDGAESVVAQTVRDKLQRVVSESVGGHATTYVHDSLGNRRRQTDPLGGVTQWLCDWAGRVLSEQNAEGIAAQTEVDEFGWRRAFTDAKGSRTVFLYDARGNCISQTTPFDADGGQTRHAVTEYSFDGAGNVTEQRVLRDAGVWLRTAYHYDSRGRLQYTVQLGEGGAQLWTRVDYDGVGNKTAVHTGMASKSDLANARTTAYRYNSFGGVTGMTDPLGRAESYQYDPVGLLQSSTDRNGVTTLYSRDALGRPLRREAKRPDGLRDLLETGYTPTGQTRAETRAVLTPTGQRQQEHRIVRAYDGRGLLVRQEELADGGTVVKAYTYDPCKNRLSVALTRNGAAVLTLLYEYDALNRLRRLRRDSATETVLAEYAYDQNGNRVSLTQPGGHVTSYRYNLANLVTRLQTTGVSPALGFDYAYDLDGNQRVKTDAAGRTTRYTYDLFGRLTREEAPAATTAYTYDRCHNRLSMSQSGVTTAYAYDKANRLTAETRTAGTTTETTLYAYDANGNLLHREWSRLGPADPGQIGAMGFSLGADGALLLEQRRYNTLNQPIEVYRDGQVTNYRHRADGLRHTKTVTAPTGTSQATTHLWDGQTLAADLADGKTICYAHGAGLAAQIIGQTQTNYLFNAHGDVVCFGQQAYDYDAFGNQTAPNPADQNPFRYCGEYLDRDTESYYLRARDYAPRLGRFMGEDPAGSGTNWYVYCGNNPVMLVDPLGLYSYVLYDSTMFNYSIKEHVNQVATAFTEIYGSETKKVDISSYSTDDFNNWWNGLEGTEVDGVSIFGHGWRQGIYLNNENNGENYLHAENLDALKQIDMDMMILYGCHNGALNEPNNLASAFAMKLGEGGRVIASDAQVYYSPILGLTNVYPDSARQEIGRFFNPSMSTRNIVSYSTFSVSGNTVMHDMISPARAPFLFETRASQVKQFYSNSRTYFNNYYNPYSH